MKHMINNTLISNNSSKGVRYIKHFLNTFISKLGLLRLHVLYKRMHKNVIVDYNYLSKEQKQALKIIDKETTEDMIQHKKIFVSNNVLDILKDYIISSNINLSIQYMYI